MYECLEELMGKCLGVCEYELKQQNLEYVAPDWFEEARASLIEALNSFRYVFSEPFKKLVITTIIQSKTKEPMTIKITVTVTPN